LKILVIGSGGREHALCWKLSQSPEVVLYASPGNPGMAHVATCIPSTDYTAVADSIQPDLTVVGPEGPLAAGIVDQFRAQGRAIVGPTAAAAQLESSKVFAKEFMRRAGIPTARFAIAETTEDARYALRQFGLPVVLKADGLAAGKGVVVAATSEQAEQVIPQLLRPGARLVIEEFLPGEEVSFIVLADGHNVLPLEASQDHKAAFDHDTGPNTGGMGAYCDGRILTPAQAKRVMDNIILPAIETMRAEDRPFTGFLYAGLMMTSDGPSVLEFNARLGDPETQALLHRMRSDFVPALFDSAHSALSGHSLEWKRDTSVCVVMAAAGYPGDVRSGDPISGVEDVDGAVVFQAGTRADNEALLTSGGRVLGVTASGSNLASAIANTYAEVAKIRFAGMHYRTDIGQKGLKRW
jgi:phosphoribosylamine---glycine ligase